MMASARAVRDYTAIEISPLLQESPRHRVRFLPAGLSVHFLRASATFAKLRKDCPTPHSKEALARSDQSRRSATGWEIGTPLTGCATIAVNMKVSRETLPWVRRSTLPNQLRRQRSACDCHSASRGGTQD